MENKFIGLLINNDTGKLWYDFENTEVYLGLYTGDEKTCQEQAAKDNGVAPSHIRLVDITTKIKTPVGTVERCVSSDNERPGLRITLNDKPLAAITYDESNIVTQVWENPYNPDETPHMIEHTFANNPMTLERAKKIAFSALRFIQQTREKNREKDTAAWLAREYSGEDSTKLLLARAGSSVEMELPWPKVQRRIAQLIADGTFLTKQERQPERQEQDARRYQVVVYHHSENGFDERMEYPTREEAEKVAQGYVDGTMEPDGFAYDGAAVYDLEQRTYLRIFGNYPDEAAQAQVTPPDLSGQPVTREGDTITIGNGEPTHEIDITVSDEEYEAIQQAIPEEKVYDPTAPVYHEGDTVYLENQEYQITELRADTVQLLPSGMAYPIFRAESRERFETLLREDARNEAITEFLPINPDTADQDLRDVLAHGLIGAPDKAEISELLRSGESNAEIAQWLSRAYPDIIETMELETGDTADYRTMTEGIELEVLDADEKRLAMLFFRWDEVAPILRGMYARQLDGFGQERA